MQNSGMNCAFRIRSSATKVLAGALRRPSSRVCAAPNVAARTMMPACSARALSSATLQQQPWGGLAADSSRSSITVFYQHCSFSSASETLADVLAKELAEETEDGRTEMPESLAELKSTIEKDWKIVDDAAVTRLIRTTGGSKVVLSFHCQDTVEGAEEAYPEEEGGEEEEPAVPFRFEILVSKAGKTLVLSCISNAGITTVDGAAMTSEDMDSVQANGLGRNQYQGPEFPELSEELQDAFQEYVFSDLGVNDDVSAFVSMYADHKEQLEYAKFLKDVPKVL